MAPQEGKTKSRKRSRADSHNAVVISISSYSEISDLAWTKKQRWAPPPDERRIHHWFMHPLRTAQSPVGENSPEPASHRSDSFEVSRFFCRPADLPVGSIDMQNASSSQEWGPRKCQSTAHFNGEIQWLHVPSSDDDLADTACSKLRNPVRYFTREKR